MYAIRFRASGTAIPIRVCAAMLVLLVGGSLPAFAEDAINPVLDDRFSFRMGALRNDIEGTITVLDQPFPETPIDIEKVGLDTTQTSPWGSMRWRFGERWALNFHYDRFDQDGTGVLETGFNFDGVFYPAGAVIDSRLRADAYILDVSYALWKQHNYELGLGLGLHAFNLDMGIGGTVSIGDESVELGNTEEEVLAPVPNLRVFGTYAFSEKISFSGSAGWLSMSYKDWDGDFLYVRGLLEYRLTDRWGIGAGYQYTDVDVEHNRDNGDFEAYDLELSGIQGYISYSF
jgi:opacity protein-like surface antigen